MRTARKTPAWIYEQVQNARTVVRSAEERRMNRLALRELNYGKSGCTADTLRCLQARDMAADTPECCKEHVRAIMRDLAAMLDAARITWWADYGTLLGYVREGGMIPHDKDADLGILAEDRDKLIALFPRLMRLGYWPRYSWPRCERFRSGDRVKVCLSRLNHTNVDVFIWHRRPGGMLDRTNYIKADQFKGREMPEAKVLPTQRGMWDGIEISAPADPEWMADHRYGPNWRTPIAANNDGVKR